MRSFHVCIGTCLAIFLMIAPCRAQDGPTHEEAAQALRKAVAFFREHVSTEGGYLWRYSADLSKREGEGVAGPRTAWVQPPGTPAVGEAYLFAHSMTHDAFYLDAAKETGYALLKGQLQSGGWDYRIEFDPEKRVKYAYRADQRTDGEKTTTLDDNTTQSALQFLMRLDRALNFEDQSIHEAAGFGLYALVKAQYPNGAWPQRYRDFPNEDEYPVKKASYPASWSRTYVKHGYSEYYTLNDNTLSDCIETMLLAADIYGETQHASAAAEGGDFLLLAQMPDPQPAWAQQYDMDMHPAWARKFEPPAITGGESQGAIRMLIHLAARTGEARYLEPIPRALAYLKSSLRPDGKLARFYELQTNRPLYFTKDYQLTYSDEDMPTHYSFVVLSNIDALEHAYQDAIKGISGPARDSEAQAEQPAILASRAREAIDLLDERGAWVEAGTLRYHEGDDTRKIIDCTTFGRRVRALAAFLALPREVQHPPAP
ncbi:MAG: polysaccharide lyase [Candidatus Hydrogenedentes bacterium]|nr:polysaccharide lyase [Candidatus Hydrogenedentota bacterium]